MADPPDEARELSLLNKVEMRIALADTESKLQTLLNTYLAPILLKLASPHAAVRNKVRRMRSWMAGTVTNRLDRL